jgi:RNA polymerase sigma factor for flagellar operon FliA
MNTNEQNELVRTHIDAARRVARKVARPLNDPDLRADVESAALVGLVEAAQRYDANHPEPFFAFAVKRIRGAALDELRRVDPLPRRERRRAKQLAAAAAVVEARTGQAANSNQVAAELGISVEDLEAQRTRMNAVARIAYDEAVEQTVGEETSVVEAIDHAQKLDALGRALPALSARDRRVVEMYYGQEMNLREIGGTLGVSESRVCQIRSRAIKALEREVQFALRAPANDQERPRSAPPVAHAL